MGRLSRIAASLFAVGVLAGATQARAGEGVYVSGHVGGSWFEDADNKGEALSVKNSFSSGYVLTGALGYEFGNGFKAEGEISYRMADIDSFKSANAGGTAVSLGSGIDGDGDVSVFGFMANGAYEYELDGGFKPYAIAGFGLANVSINNAKVGGVLLADDDDTVFAYQFGAGIAYELNENVSVDLSYRYFATSDPTFKDAAGDSFDSELSTHNVMLGLTYKF